MFALEELNQNKTFAHPLSLSLFPHETFAFALFLFEATAKLFTQVNNSYMDGFKINFLLFFSEKKNSSFKNF